MQRSTGGMIRRFPGGVSPRVLLMLASALAARVSGLEPFDVVPGNALGPHSRWASQLRRVLRTPHGGRLTEHRGWSHEQFIATTAGAGDVAVHTAWAGGGLRVTSVAAQPGVPAADVLAAAYQLAVATATGGQVDRVSLFTLPLGLAPLWQISERPARVDMPDGGGEECTAVLPAWSVASLHDLTSDPGLGFRAAAASLAGLLHQDRAAYRASQAAVARYSRTGFEAAAVTGLAVLGASLGKRGRLRTAELRFGHPFAVVAVPAPEPFGDGARTPWQGLPVFSAWVTHPDDAGDPT